MKNAFFYFTREVNKKNLRYVKKLYSDIANDNDFFVLSYQENAKTYAIETMQPDGIRQVIISKEALSHYFSSFPLKFRNETDWSVMPGNLDLVQIACTKLVDDYDYYWFCEDDVRYTGKFNELIKQAEAYSSDLIATNFRAMPKNWRQAYSIKNAERKPGLCFLPFFRVSDNFIKCLVKEYELGLSGHHEATWPIVLDKYQLQGTDFNEIAQLYTSNKESETLAPGSFVYTPAKLVSGIKKHTLYHPVKPLYAFLRRWFYFYKFKLESMTTKK